MTSDQTHTVTSPTITTTVTSSTPAGGGATRIRTATHTSVNSTSPLQPKAEPARMSEPLQQPVVLPDHAKQQDLGHGYGETTEQHMHHSDTAPTHHWGLPISSEERLFYALAIPSWCLNIVSGIIGSYFDTGTIAFIITVSLFQAFSWAAWWQTVAQMLQRASWTRDEGNLVDRRRFLHLAVRLNRLMWVCSCLPLPYRLGYDHIRLRLLTRAACDGYSRPP